MKMDIVPLAKALATGGLLVAVAILGGCRAGKPSEDASAKADPVEFDSWHLVRIGGKTAGYEQTLATRVERQGQSLLRVESTSRIKANRFGEAMDITVLVTSLETLAGGLIEFSAQLPLGNTLTTINGHVAGETLSVTTTVQGTAKTNEVAWKPEYVCPSGPTLSLLREPMRAGQTRTLYSYDVMFAQVVPVQLKARRMELVDLPDGPRELLRISTVTTVQGMPLDGLVWTDAQGRTLATEMKTMNIRSVQVSESEALEALAQADLDLGLDMLVPVATPLENPHATRRVVYRVHLDGEDPASVLPTGISQQVTPVDANTADITVVAVRPSGDAPAEAVAEEYLEPNAIIQSDDEAVVAMARKVAPDESDPWKIAVALEGYVHDLIPKGDYSTPFASAAEVARNPGGDCTEHAVLLAALARARGIPSRVAMGAVYYNQAFAYHMWTEVSIGGKWIPLDATLGLGGIGAAHLKMASDSLQGAGLYAASLPIMKILGRLKIEILEVE